MQVPAELWSLTATEVSRLIKKDRLTVEDYAKALMNPDLVLSQARVLDQISHDQRGQLHGVAIAIKDIMDTKDRTPGGSSAGSAAAVADFQVPLSFGTQTGGSVIRPASYKGTYAMKPTFNTIAGGGIMVASPELDTIGYFAHCMEDLKRITDVLSLPTEISTKEIPLEEARVGFVKSPFWSSAGPGTVAALKKAADILRKHGVTVEDVEFPDKFDDAAALRRMFKVIFVTDSGASFYSDYLIDTTKTKLDPDVRAFVEDAPKFSREEVREVFDYYGPLRPVLNKIAARYSALITPSATDEAPLELGDMGSPIFNSVWTVRNPWALQKCHRLTYFVLGARMPVINVLAFAGPNGMPVGLPARNTNMASQRVPGLFHSTPLRRRAHQGLRCLNAHRKASTFNGMTELSEDVDPSSSMHIGGPSEEHIKSFDPIARTKRRERQLPPSR
ncbi:hypothetical protein P7C71_g5360, partial [Lecanoromycetidae sp. Uapishka_2]